MQKLIFGVKLKDYRPLLFNPSARCPKLSLLSSLSAFYSSTVSPDVPPLLVIGYPESEVLISVLATTLKCRECPSLQLGHASLFQLGYCNTFW